MKKFSMLVAVLAVTVSYAQETVNRQELQKIAAESNSKYEEAKAIEATKYADHPMGEGAALQAIDNGTPVYYHIDSRPQQRSMNVDFLSDGSLPGG